MMTENPTADDIIVLVPSDLGVTVYVEIIIIEMVSDSYDAVVNTACGRFCNTYERSVTVRDLAVPNESETIKSLLCSKGRKSVDFVPYYRDYNRNTLSPASYGDLQRNRTSVVFVSSAMSDSQVRFAMDRIGAQREILPSRMVR